MADTRPLTDADIDRARRFYERAGREPDGTREFWTPRGTTAQLPEPRYATAL